MTATSLWLDRPERAPYDSVDVTRRYDTVVVGAGLTGLVTALLLTRAGQSVAVLEAREIGAAATGNTTAKISVLQGTTLSKIASKQPQQQVRRYVEANLAAQAWLVDYCASKGVAVQHETAYTYATSRLGEKSVREELRIARGVGLDVSYCTEIELPFEITGAVAVPDQAQFDPMDALLALAEDAVNGGAHLTEGLRVRGVHRGLRHVDVTTDRGSVCAARVVLATGSPILDRGGYFARMEPLRSYAAAYDVPGAVPRGMYLSADSPSRSIRYAPTPDGDLLLVGGNGHTVGREASPMSDVQDLDDWTERHFPGATRTHRWSAQDYESLDALPYAGPLLPGDDRILVATGYDKWGMTNGVAAAMVVEKKIVGGSLAWSSAYDTYRLRQLAGVFSALRMNAGVAFELTKGWAAPLVSQPEPTPAEGQGHVRRGILPTAVCTVGGTTHTVSAVCPHLGGIVAWNDAEKSWDCPLHGSRFAADGTVLEGPVTSNLKKVD